MRILTHLSIPKTRRTEGVRDREDIADTNDITGETLIHHTHYLKRIYIQNLYLALNQFIKTNQPHQIGSLNSIQAASSSSADDDDARQYTTVVTNSDYYSQFDNNTSNHSHTRNNTDSSNYQNTNRRTPTKFTVD